MEINRIELSDEEKSMYKDILIKTLKAFDKFCKDNNLTYFACGGTLLGAVRHRGIIPWDDDIDVVMPINDFQKLQSLKNKCTSSGYEIKDYNDEGYYLPYIKFIDRNTTIWEVKENEYVIGVFIDVFPLFSTNGNLAANYTKIEEYKRLFNRLSSGYKKYPLKTLIKAIMNLQLRNVYGWIKGLLYYKHFQIKMRQVFIDYHEKLASVNSGDYLINYFATYPVEKELFKKEWFEESTLLPFEDTQISVPSKYHEILNNMFGDYMTPPPVEQRVSHHYLYFMDLNRRWTIDEIKRIKKNGK